METLNGKHLSSLSLIKPTGTLIEPISRQTCTRSGPFSLRWRLSTFNIQVLTQCFKVCIGRSPWNKQDFPPEKASEIWKMRFQHPEEIQEFPSEVQNNEFKRLMVQCWRREPDLRPTANMVLRQVEEFCVSCGDS